MSYSLLRLTFFQFSLMLLSMSPIFSGCINLRIGESSVLRANNLIFSEPSTPFTLFKDADTDKSWQSQKTGNIIAFYSDCSKNSDRHLDEAFRELAKSFDRIDSKNQESIFYNGREAIHGHVDGYIDGIRVSLESLQFNKNKCFYQISFSGVSNQFNKELNYFEKFKAGFAAP